MEEGRAVVAFDGHQCATRAEQLRHVLDSALGLRDVLEYETEKCRIEWLIWDRQRARITALKTDIREARSTRIGFGGF